MLNIFLGRKPLPEYKLKEPASGQLQEIIVKEGVGYLKSVRDVVRSSIE